MSDETMLWLIGVAIVVAAVVIGFEAWIGWWLADQLLGADPVPGSYPAMVSQLWNREATWPHPAATITTGVLVVISIVVLAALWRRFDKRRGGAMGRVARRLPRGRGLSRFTGKNAAGPVIGQVLGRPGRPILRMTDEDQCIIVAGPRTGKTTSLVIPAGVAHDGPLLVTSNKRDVWDHVAGPRAERGKVWLFDPQLLAGSRPGRMWWNPLDMATTVKGARRLASLWEDATSDPGATGDDYFGPEGQDLLASLLLAAASGGRPVSDVHEWLAHPEDQTPVELLTGAGFRAMASGLEGRMAEPPKQRAGIYGTARKIVSFLADPDVVAWIEPGHGREQFRSESLSRGTDTIIMLSKEGEGSTGPIVASLTASILEAAEAHASTLPGGRLARPLLAELDECANICRIKGLDNLYSHYGSRGILLMAVAQSFAQLKEAFGRDGADKMFSSANVAIYAGSEKDTAFLRQMSELAGEYDERKMSWSTSTGGHRGSQRSRSVQTHRRSVFDVAALAALERGHGLVFLSGTRPVLVKMPPWWDGPYAEAIKASVAAETVAPPDEAEAA